MAEIYGGDARAPGMTEAHHSKWPMILIAALVLLAVIIALAYWRG